MLTTKKLLLASGMLLCATAAQAQILTPVKWSYAAKRTSPTEATVYLKATMDEGWHVYSQTGQKGGPVKTTITFVPAKGYAGRHAAGAHADHQVRAGV